MVIAVDQQWATIIGTSITASVTLTAALLAYVFGRLQKAFEVRYTSFYEHQAEVASDLYTQVYTISNEFKQWLALKEKDDGSEDAENRLSQQRSTIEEAIEKFRKCYAEQDLWISRDLWNNLDTLHKELDEKWLAVELPTRGGSEKEEVENWIESRFPIIRSELRAEFHRALEIEYMNLSQGEAVIQGPLRILVGLVGTICFGLGVGALLAYLLDNRVGLLAGFLMGLERLS
jgi:hypothetical protein